MDPTVWGPHLWHFMHTISFNYHPSNKEFYYIFFTNLSNVIPCDKCKTHYKEFLKNNNIRNSLSSRDKLIQWVIDCHNNVNKKNKKKIWSKDEVIEYYNKLYENVTSNETIDKCNSGKCKTEHFSDNGNIDNNTNLMLYVIICILLMIILFLIFNKKK